LRQGLRDAVDAVPAGKKGTAGVNLTLEGLSFEVGYKPKTWLEVSSYAGKRWAGDWQVGARAGVTW